MRRVELFEMPVDAIRFEEALDLCVELARGEAPAYVVTANVDHVVRFHRRREVRPLYTEADVVVADGMPLIWASRLLGKPLPERVAGSDLFPALCARSAGAGLSVFFLGGAPGSAEGAARELQSQHPDLRIAGTYCPDYGFEADEAECRRIVERIRRAGPDILFVGLGSPKQEKWIVENKDACGATLNMGVGISFSFVCGDVVRAPAWVQRIGMEWAHRLIQEPNRLWKRYLVQDVAFAWLVLRELLKGPRRKRGNESTTR